VRAGFLLVNPRERDNLEDPDVDVRTVLNGSSGRGIGA
jgi:hypothetical protein